jgi:hypothetical protein
MAMSQWWTLTEAVVQYDRDAPGVYELGNAAESVIYVGSTNEIRRRLREHMGEDAKSCIKKNAAKYRIDYRTDYAAEERRRYDSFVAANGRAPLCNSVRP